MHIAQINIGRVRYPVTDPRMADFVDNLAWVNALADDNPDFVWRLKDDTGNATSITPYTDPTVLVNMSVWRTSEALYEYVYRTVHRRFVQRRKEWFELLGAAHLALWWIEEGRIPEVAEGRRRVAHIQRYGAAPHAFNFKALFPPALAVPLGPVDEEPPSADAYLSCA